MGLLGSGALMYGRPSDLSGSRRHMVKAPSSLSGGGTRGTLPAYCRSPGPPEREVQKATRRRGSWSAPTFKPVHSHALPPPFSAAGLLPAGPRPIPSLFPKPRKSKVQQGREASGVSVCAGRCRCQDGHEDGEVALLCPPLGFSWLGVSGRGANTVVGQA